MQAKRDVASLRSSGLQPSEFVNRAISFGTDSASGVACCEFLTFLNCFRFADHQEVALNSVCDHPAAAGIYPQSALALGTFA
jgi:hypothetical protein